MKTETKKNSFHKGPWMLKNGDIANFVKVTDNNRKQAIVIGRILYVLESIGRYWQFNGVWSIDPRFDKGWYHYPFKPWEKSNNRHFRVFIDKDFKYDEWVSSNKALVDKFMDKEMLFIRPTDPILQYFKE